MVWSSASLSAGLVSAATDNAPLCVAYNAVRDASVRKWTAAGGGADADITLSTAPAAWACDGDLRFGTNRTAGTSTAHYFNLQWTTSITFDVIFMKILGGSTIASITVELSDDGVTWGSAISTWSASLNPVSRMIDLTLNGGSNRYGGTGYMRIVIAYGAPASAPDITELVVGQRRQMSRRPDQGSGYDDRPYGSAYTDLAFRGRDRQRFVEASGFTDWRGGWTPAGEDQYGLDDLATLRAIMSDSEGLKNPVLWVDQPSSFPEYTTHGFLSFGEGGLRLDYEDWAMRGVSFAHEELPPFVINDTRYVST